MFSLKQLRNTFFALLNTSTAKMSLDDTMSQTTLLLKEQALMQEKDRQLDHAIKATTASLTKSINDNWDECSTAQRANEKVANQLKSELRGHADHLLKHKDILDEHKKGLTSTSDSISRCNVRLDKVKE